MGITGGGCGIARALADEVVKVINARRLGLDLDR